MAPSTDAPESFAAVSQGLEFPSGLGIPGRVWETGEPLWVEDVAQEVNFTRAQAAETAGLHAAIALPIVAGEDVIGVIEFFSRDIRQPDTELLRRLLAMGGQIGQFVDRHRAEQEAERLKNEFFALVSHELRTPLTSIVGYLELLLDPEDDALDPEQRRFLQVVERNSLRLQRLVNDLLFVAQLEAGELSLELGTVDLGAVARQAIDTLRHRAERASIDLNLAAGSVPPCSGDAERMGQAVENLVSNAIKYTPQGGRVEVRVRAHGDRALVEVEDSGMGVPAAEQEHLFERFYRASSATERAIPGVGLGLAIVAAIVNGHGGRVGAESEEGVGSRFWIELPLEAPRDALP